MHYDQDKKSPMLQQIKDTELKVYLKKYKS